MTNEDILLVQQSWSKIAPVKQITAELFYGKLSELDPALTPLFDDDRRESHRRFVRLLDATVRGLGRADMLLGALKHLVTRSPVFGRSERHRGAVITALLWTLSKALRNDFTPAVKAAWVHVLGGLSQMLSPPPHSRVAADFA